MRTDFRSVAIVNRGEPAMRLIHAVREFNRERQTQIRTIALYTEPDRRAMFVREADEAVNLGSPFFTDPGDGQRKNRYLDYASLEKALRSSGAEAVWVGWGFVAEHAGFADLCDSLGVVFIGPPGDVMRQLGDKITSKILAEKARVPVAPWSGGPVETLDEARAHAERLGFPLIVKATAGGGGRGIRKVLREADLADAFESARSEALKGFGDPTVFLEKLFTGARHVEVQIIADNHGSTWAVGVRDCTIQRRHQKVLEESPSPVLSEEQDRIVREAAARLGSLVGYRNAGTVEFLYDPVQREFSFMEVNARLQVEHPVTEMTTGLDLVKLQLQVARGEKLEGQPPPQNGCAIEVRLNAEDPFNSFAPAPGLISLFRMPHGPGVRVDTGVDEGDRVAAEFDSMIAKIIAFGANRNEALARLRRALSEAAVVIEDGTSNKGFLLELLGRAEVQRGEYNVAWLDQLVQRGEHVSRQYAEVALLQAAVEAYEAEMDIEKAQFLNSAARGRPEVRQETGRNIELGHQGVVYPLGVFRLGTHRYRIEVDGRRIELEVENLGPSQRTLVCCGRRFRVLSLIQGTQHLVEINGVPHRFSRDQGGVVRAPSPAVVVSVHVAEGDEVAVGQRLVVLEAMKIEMSVLAPTAGRVRKVPVAANVQVGAGASLVLIEPSKRQALGLAAERLHFGDFGNSAAPAGQIDLQCARNLDDLKCLLLGYDVNPEEISRLLAQQGEFCRGMPADNAEMLRSEDEILRIFVEDSSLFQRTPADFEETARQGAESCLFTYLRDLDAQGRNLPPTFVDNLKRVLRHYEIESLERSPQLEESLIRIHKAHQRIDSQIGPILGVLERRLEHVAVLAPKMGDEFRVLLDRMIEETRGVFPTVNDLAREVRYRYFEQPLLEKVRDEACARAEAQVARLEADPPPEERQRLVDELVECPQPLKSMLSGRFETAPGAVRRSLLEVLTRRYYRIRDLREVRTLQAEGHDFATARYEHRGDQLQIVTTHARYADLERVGGILSREMRNAPRDVQIMVDFYLWREGPPTEAESVQEEVKAAINRLSLPRPARRIVVAVAGPHGGVGMGSMLHFTLRHTGHGYEEERLYRNLHPMMGKRLHVQRLDNFDIERLESAEDVYLFRGVARSNPRDERLFAIAEVRDMTPVRDESGRIVQLPNFERMLMEALAGIRHIQSQRPVRNRLHWNRILLYVWPPFTLRPDELNDLIRKLSPATEGLGLETIVLHVRQPKPEGGLKDTIIHLTNLTNGGLVARFDEPTTKAIEPLSGYEQKVVRLRQRGLLYPYEIIRMLTPSDGPAQEFPRGEFVEYDLDAENRLVPVKRPFGLNESNIVVGLVKNFTTKHPEGMLRVALFGDPTSGMGNLAEGECRRIMEGISLAERLGVPVEWFAVSAGAKISMESGTENMDWIGAVLRRLVEFTQAGGEVNVIVYGINVGAQPYWNAEATMLMHTKGILVMTPEGAMVLTGKQALDYSGGVSAEDNSGIGGFERIMGPNGQAQYFARDINEACRILLRHYEHSYRVPGERFPRRAATSDPFDRDIRDFPHGSIYGVHFDLVGDIFSEEKNPERKKPFDIRRVMEATIDQDQGRLERWFRMQDAEIAVVWDSHLGGYPVCMIGLESRPLTRLGFVPAYGPDQWTGGTLFPLSSKKVARAINAASDNRPVVVLANLSGFDGSPESMRQWQLEFGAEIGRAVVNFKGPIVFCVISRYHGGAFVVFSRTLNENLEIIALEGSYASVIGGAPAAAVVFARDVDKRTCQDSRILSLEAEIAAAQGAEKVRLRARLAELTQTVRSEKLGEVADEFDSVHSVQRARKVGSVHTIIPAARMRPYLIEAVGRGIRKELERVAAQESPASV